MSGKMITPLKGIVHTKYLVAYNELLKYDEVLDHDIDNILKTYFKVLGDKSLKLKLSNEPSSSVINKITQLTLDRLKQSVKPC